MSNGLWYIKKDVVDDYVGNIKDYIPEEYKDIVLTFLHKYHNLLPSYADHLGVLISVTYKLKCAVECPDKNFESNKFVWHYCITKSPLLRGYTFMPLEDFSSLQHSGIVPAGSNLFGIEFYTNYPKDAELISVYKNKDNEIIYIFNNGCEYKESFDHVFKFLGKNWPVM